MYSVDDFIYPVGANPPRMTLLIVNPYKAGNPDTANSATIRRDQLIRSDFSTEFKLCTRVVMVEFVPWVGFLRKNISRFQEGVRERYIYIRLLASNTIILTSKLFPIVYDHQNGGKISRRCWY